MQQIISISTMRMTSREIADMVEKRHDNVKRTIETLVERGVITPPKVQKTPTGGCPVTEYVFVGEQGKRDSIAVVAKLSLPHIAEMVDRWGRTEDLLKSLLDAFENFDVPKDMQDMFVYAIQEEESGRIKLGISRDPHARVAQLQTGNSQKLTLLAYYKADDGFKSEADAQNRAGAYHIRGEWFNSNAIGVMQ